MVRETELYEVLNVSVEADENEIKRSYRRLALKYHPDKNTGDEAAADMFKKVSNAYEVLSDAEKRRVYDKYGKEGLEGGMGEGGGFHDATDIFSMFFGGGARERGEPKPKDIVHELEVKLDDLYNGATKKVMISRDRFCSTCSGSGLKEGRQRTACTSCRGRGVQVRTQQVFPGFLQQVQMRCDRCAGEGTMSAAADLCTTCRGKRTIREKCVLDVHIERGASKSDHFTFVGEGNQEPGIRLAGDVLMFLSVRRHHIFHRVGDHLMMRCPITLQEALCGFEMPIEHLDGRKVLMRASPGQVVHGDSAWSIYGEGMPIKGTGGLQKGKLFVCFEVEWPQTLPAAQVAKIASALKVPAKLGKLGGQLVVLSECKPGSKSKGSKKGASKGIAARFRATTGAQSSRARSQEEEDEFEDVTDDDDDEEAHSSGRQRFRGGQQGRCGRGEAQTVECAQQ